VPRRRASSSPSVTVWMPPIRSPSLGFMIKFSRVLPCPVATSCTPRPPIVRAAPASIPLPTASLTLTSGMRLCTASLMACVHPLGQTHHALRSIPNCRDPVQRPLDARSVVFTETAHPRHYVLQILIRHGFVAEQHLAAWIPRLRLSPQVEHHFEKIRAVRVAE